MRSAWIGEETEESEMEIDSDLKMNKKKKKKKELRMNSERSLLLQGLVLQERDYKMNEASNKQCSGSSGAVSLSKVDRMQMVAKPLPVAVGGCGMEGCSEWGPRLEEEEEEEEEEVWTTGKVLVQNSGQESELSIFGCISSRGRFSTPDYCSNLALKTVIKCGNVDF
ncbi:hypothetical protein T10_2195 [Trichinella papuae]|uniref:Uncharacterized protein n=1 Tax=Trichinella papuae TaxID=268474 RepID=A0A0V1MYH5_9BILA|nr:hypothetical protein T10_2195 [Trichinella papuae]